MKLAALIKGLKTKKITGSVHKNITSIHYDSLTVKKESLFICKKGSNTDGHLYSSQAINNGATVLISEHEIAHPSSITNIIVPDASQAQAQISANFYNHPDKQLHIIAITGTNGKTTTSYFLKQLFCQLKIPCGLIGTIAYEFGKKQIAATRTTPESTDLFGLFDAINKQHIKWVIMEVSSHAIDQNRVFGIDFAGAIFTNLSSEHLDYHKTMPRYFSAKNKLFTRLSASTPAIINTDDEYGKKIGANYAGPTYTYGTAPSCFLQLVSYELHTAHSHARIRTPLGNYSITISLPGKYNLYNAIAALSVGFIFNFDIDTCIQALQTLKNVPGRMESVGRDLPFSVFIDYAHTEDALEKALESLRLLPSKRIICVFGCGGNRDQNKRAKMGKVSGLLADVTIITTDNPRNENPLDIIKQIERGVKQTSGDYSLIPDRKEAIFHALGIANENDIVLIAGRGHETVQDFGNKQHFLCDQLVVQEWKRCITRKKRRKE
ncbi:UDP-N-acetylmuramoyl-L-alanyl-D-glutamate--2,6-diaminopimelate ligase [Chlamydiota bacterium]